jgi:hypothetical protein
LEDAPDIDGEDFAMMEDYKWKGLIRGIENGRCTPFLGPGLAQVRHSAPAELAQHLVEEEGYPLRKSQNLFRVAQYLAAKYNPDYPRDQLADQFQREAVENAHVHSEPHRVLAELPMSVYVTTYYDDLMWEALTDEHPANRRNPIKRICRWKDFDTLNRDDERIGVEFTSSPGNPVVYHLFGHYEVPESMVLTEGSYIEFPSRSRRESKSGRSATRCDTGTTSIGLPSAPIAAAGWPRRAAITRCGSGRPPRADRFRRRSNTVAPFPE